jgi:hypothetical protein
LTLPAQREQSEGIGDSVHRPGEGHHRLFQPRRTRPSGANDRRGQIWGKLVPYGMTDLGFHGGKLSPWRGGANENTVFAVSDPVTIEGQPLAAGQYGLHSFRAGRMDRHLLEELLGLGQLLL